jgi:hypothetical protein
MPRPTLHTCAVCALPSPELVCSRRCVGLRRLRAGVDAAPVAEALRDAVHQLDRGASADPGELAQAALAANGLTAAPRDALTVTRAAWFALRAAGDVTFVQRGQPIPPGRAAADITGGWRVARRR